MKTLNAAALCLAVPFSLPASASGSSELDQLAIYAKPADELRPISFIFENDRFVQSDDNYTNGVQLTRSKSTAGRGRLGKLMRSARCSTDDCSSGRMWVRDSVGQLMYTPHDISDPQPQPQQRPWAGMLYLYRTYTLRVNQDEELTVGGMVWITGPAAKAEQAQKFVHKHITSSSEPKGWDHQLGGSLGLMATVEQRRTMWSMDRGKGWRLKSAGYWRVGVGNIMTYGALGATLVYSQHHDGVPSVGGIQDKRFVPLDTSRAAPVSYSCLGASWLACSFDANAEVKVMAYNVFLDGRWGESDPSVDSKPVIVDLSAGVKLSFPKAVVAGRGTPFVRFQMTRRTREYTSAAPSRSQSWGALSFGTEF